MEDQAVFRRGVSYTPVSILGFTQLTQMYQCLYMDGVIFLGECIDSKLVPWTPSSGLTLCVWRVINLLQLNFQWAKSKSYWNGSNSILRGESLWRMCVCAQLLGLMYKDQSVKCQAWHTFFTNLTDRSWIMAGFYISSGNHAKTPSFPDQHYILTDESIRTPSHIGPKFY